MSLQLSSVGHRYGAVQALDGVSLCLRPGDCYGFIGHNGAGKTTAIRIALGLVRPTRGRVLIDGFDAARHPREARARLGGLVETPGFHGAMGGRGNLLLLAGLQGIAGRDAVEEVERVLDLVGLGADAARAVRTYSQGMRQRLGIAQALLGSPRYVLLDEPTNGLDPEGIADVRSLFGRLSREEGCTILISSHRLHELAGLCNRIGVLRGGRLLVEEETAHLLAAGSGRYLVATDRDGEASAVLEGLGLEPSPGEERGLEVELGSTRPGSVARALVAAGLELETLALRLPTLEEIYLRSGDEVSPRRGAAAQEAGEPAPPAPRRAPPGSLRRMVRYELRRLFHGPSLPLLLGVPVLLGLLDVWRRWRGIRADLGAVEAGTLGSATDVTAFEGIGVALQAAVPLAALTIAGLASQSIAGELGRGTLRNLLLRPLRRVDVVLGKALAHSILVAGFHAVLVLSTAAAASIAFDFGDVEEILPNGLVYTYVTAEEVWPELALAVLSPLAPLLACMGIGLAAGAVARAPAAALALSLATVVALDLARALARPLGLEAWLPTAHVPSPLGDSSYLGYFVDFCQGVSNAWRPDPHATIVTSGLWLLVTVLVAACFVSRRSVP